MGLWKLAHASNTDLHRNRVMSFGLEKSDQENVVNKVACHQNIQRTYKLATSTLVFRSHTATTMRRQRRVQNISTINE